MKRLAQPERSDLLEGFCPEPNQEEQIALNADGIMLFLRLADIEWLETADGCVMLRAGRLTHRLRDTLDGVAAKLPPGRFLRISRSTLVNIEHILGVQRMLFDEWEVLLHNGARLIPSRAYLENLEQIGLHLPDSATPLASSRPIPGSATGNC